MIPLEASVHATRGSTSTTAGWIHAYTFTQPSTPWSRRGTPRRGVWRKSWPDSTGMLWEATTPGMPPLGSLIIIYSLHPGGGLDLTM